MQKSTAEADNGLIALNHVHSIATRLWTEKLPATSSQNQRGKSRGGGGRQDYQRRITPVQIYGHPQHDGIGRKFEHKQSQENQFLPPPAHQYYERPNPSKKRAQIKSLPRKPPDIQNLDLFPPIGAEPQPQRVVTSPTSVQAPQNKAAPNPFAATAEESFDPKSERTKIFTGVQKVQTQISTSTTHTEVSPTAVKVLKRTNSSESQSDKGRSGELFAQLSPEQIQELTKLSSNFSESLDSNLCRSLLAEFTFLCQLLVANNDEAVTSVTSGQAEVLASLAPRVWFVTRVFELQLPLISSISSDIIQILNDFYPHRIPKPLRKKFESIILNRNQEAQKRNFGLSNNFGSSVIFQNERDGRNNFPHQKDCQDFGKQRDLFYAVREIWTCRQKLNQGPAVGFDPAYAKVKQIFAMNSSPTNLSRLASLFISQCLLDSSAISNSKNYDPGSIENVQRILTSNPSKYEKLRQRMLVPDGMPDGNQPIPDPILFLKYFISTSALSEFTQHLIDHAIHEIHKLESDYSDSDAVYNTRKIHLLAQILGFLYFLPYRDDEYKKPIGPINVEIYLQSQIALRFHQSFPLDLTSILIAAITQRRLAFSLPWIIELLSKADHVTFHLPSYKSVLSLISSIYRELLSVIPNENVPFRFSEENKTLLRFMCGKLFGLPGFPDFYLFGNELKPLAHFFPKLPAKIGVKIEDDGLPLDMNPGIGSTFLPVWFRQEMKQIMTILTTNATVRGSIPAQTPGIVKHIRAIPEKTPNSVEAKVTGNLQLDLEAQFFLIHPPFVKKTVDFVSERVSSNFLKNLRSKTLGEIKTGLIETGGFGYKASVQCKEVITMQFEEYSNSRCSEVVNLLLGDVVSESVRTMCEKICSRIAKEKVEEWANQHVTKELFPEVFSPVKSVVPPKPMAKPNENVSTNQKPGTLFQIIRALHLTIQRLHNCLPIDGALIDRILEDSRLITEKPWVSHRTIDLALALIVFSPREFTVERQAKFIAFWKNIWSEESNTFLRPRNLIMLSMCPLDLKVTFQKLSSLMKALLKEKLVTVREIQESCMDLLRQDWPVPTRIQISEFLKDVLPELEPTEEKEILDWIAWYCGKDDEDF